MERNPQLRMLIPQWICGPRDISPPYYSVRKQWEREWFELYITVTRIRSKDRIAVVVICGLLEKGVHSRKTLFSPVAYEARLYAANATGSVSV